MRRAQRAFEDQLLEAVQRLDDAYVAEEDVLTRQLTAAADLVFRRSDAALGGGAAHTAADVRAEVAMLVTSLERLRAEGRSKHEVLMDVVQRHGQRLDGHNVHLAGNVLRAIDTGVYISSDRMNELVGQTRAIVARTGDPTIAKPEYDEHSGLTTADRALLGADRRADEEEEEIVRKARLRRSLYVFLGGIFVLQVASNSLKAVQTLTLIHVTGKPSIAALVIVVATYMDSFGTALGGWAFQIVYPRTLLILGCFFRAVIMTCVALLFSLNALTTWSAFALYAIDGVTRGVLDTARQAYPTVLAGNAKAELGKINAKFYTVMEVGGLVGPIVQALLIVQAPGAHHHHVTGRYLVPSNWLVPCIFFLGTFVFTLNPRVTSMAQEKASKVWHVRDVAPLLLGNELLGIPWLAVLFLQFQRLRAMISSFFAVYVFHKPVLSLWIYMSFGIGEVIGAQISHATHHIKPTGPVFWSALGMFAFACSWIPHNEYFMMVMAAFFGVTNMVGRHSTQSFYQSHIPPGAAGMIVGANRFFIKIFSSIIKVSVSIAFHSAATHQGAFVIISSVIGFFGAIQLLIALRLFLLLRPKPDTLALIGDEDGIVDGVTANEEDQSLLAA